MSETGAMGLSGVCRAGVFLGRVGGKRKGEEEGARELIVRAWNGMVRGDQLS